ncbi:hypothetical protein CFP65_4581 [Kitasatospora sp. MMS16-BH015]|uniref:hypothetical protein n=1 Tax=Kitasatospora sp. MMS16-BH015 TaxID=2018025 RepID=UPI000CA10F5E|nr:hypothetical protein [Kitasatospora sp. MMS16-BH015]AUG79318.1 hypothetical protein CFP65_4581 [Kitasatospora sp. MMS16-BH015]
MRATITTKPAQPRSATTSTRRAEQDEPRRSALGPAAVSPAAFGRAALGTAVRGAVGLPLAVAAVPLALTGGARRAARVQLAVLRRFSPQRVRPGAPTANPVRVLAHSLLAVLPALAAFAATAVGAFTVYSGYLYFLRPDASFALGHPFTADRHFDDAWGGPTLVGAWLTHSLVALGIQVLALGAVHLLTAVQDRAARLLLAPASVSAADPAPVPVPATAAASR